MWCNKVNNFIGSQSLRKIDGNVLTHLKQEAAKQFPSMEHARTLLAACTLSVKDVEKRMQYQSFKELKIPFS